MTFPLHRGRRLRRTPALRAMARKPISPSISSWRRCSSARGAACASRLRRCPGTRGCRRTSRPPKRPRWRGSASPPCCCSASRRARTRSAAARGIPRARCRTPSRRIKRDAPSLAVWADVCLCEYTDHGHCGVLDGGAVDNDATLPLLAQAAVAYARAGADVIAPSDMMDGRVGAIRAGARRRRLHLRRHRLVRRQVRLGVLRAVPRGRRLDAAAAAIGAAIRWIRRTSARPCARPLADVDEGADMVMVKPGLPYLDVIRAIRERVDVPVVAYQVSGEFAMLHAAADRGWVDLPRAMMETAIALRRAGADLLITYFARELAATLHEAARRRGPAGGPAMSDALVAARAPGSTAPARVTPGGVHSPVRAFAAMQLRSDRRRRAPQARSSTTNTAATYHRLHRRLGTGAARPRASGRRAAVVDAARRGMVFGLASPPEVDLAERIVARVPGCEMIRFVVTGTEATMSAVRVARAATGRRVVVKFAGAYHGHADMFLVSAGSGAATFGMPNSPGVTAGAVADTAIARFNDLDSVDQLLCRRGRRRRRGDRRAGGRQHGLRAARAAASSRACASAAPAAARCSSSTR